MELPITPKFFKKLEIYQEIKRLDKRNAKHSEWDMEKDFLLWAHTDHFHLGSFLSTKNVLDRLNKLNKYNNKDLNDHVFKMMQNLKEHGWAEWWPREWENNAIKINKEGLLVGEVIFDISRSGRIFYESFILISWLTIISGIVIVIANAISTMVGLFLSGAN